MAKTLTGKIIKESYKGLLTVSDDNTPLGTTPVPVTDGEGNESPLLLSTNKVKLKSGTPLTEQDDVATVGYVDSVAGSTQPWLDGVLTTGTNGATNTGYIKGLFGDLQPNAFNLGADAFEITEFQHDTTLGTNIIAFKIIKNGTPYTDPSASFKIAVDGVRYLITWDGIIGSFATVDAGLAGKLDIDAVQYGFQVFDIAVSGGIPDAPNDGKQYGRQSQTWTEIPPNEVTSVNGQTGDIVLDADEIPAGAANKYTTQADINRLANTSGTNTGDQDISGIATNAADIAANQQLLLPKLTKLR